MKQKLLIKLLFLMLILLNINSYAQVTIGTDEAPTEGAMLQLKSVSDIDSNGDINATQGLGLPRVQLVKKDELQPMYSASVAAGLDEATKKAHKGLLVFNIKEVEAEELGIGLNFWDGEKWIAVSESQSKAEIEVDCKRVRVYGQYYRRAPLMSSNYLIMPINITKKGDYNIMATTGNGYYFQATGVFNDTGNAELRLEGIGTPSEVGTDAVTFTNNGSPIASLCSVSVNVVSATLSYRINNCDSIKVFGDYQTRHDLSGNANYVEIPVEVIMDGTTNWETDIVNGIKFVVNYTFDALGDAILVAKAQGTPRQSGKFTYNFKTDGAIRNECSFVVDFFSTLGTFGDPGCKCLDIYEERPDIGNGEYFLIDCLDPAAELPVKTFCDIKNGGYTLVWSFSERTAYDSYTPAGMEVTAAYRFAMDVPRNRVTTETGKIDYTDYRLTRSEFQHFPNSTSKPTLKVRVCENPTDMEDAWGLNNYGITTPRTISENPIESSFGARLVPTTGKLWGKNWAQKATGGGAYGGWDEVCGNRLAAMYSNTAYPTHWDMGGCATLFDVVPNKGGANNQQRMSANNNMFGWFGETQPNHHFGKCGGTAGSDYDFTTKTCSSGSASLVPHSFNNGEGRYLQWFVK